MSDIVLRPALRNDGADLAILDNLASHGASRWFWQGVVNEGKAEDAFALGRQRLMADDACYGWTNAIIAEVDGVTAGSCTAYVMPAPEEDDEFGKSDAFAPVFDLFASIVGEWCIDSLAIYPQMRRRGIARTLMADAFGKGRAAGHERAHLVMEDGNTAAIALYFSLGFRESDRRPYRPIDGETGRAPISRNWLLMTASLLAADASKIPPS